MFLSSIQSMKFQRSGTPDHENMKITHWNFRDGGSASEEPACEAGEPGSIPGSGRPPGEGNGHPFQSSHLENSMNREGRV